MYYARKHRETTFYLVPPPRQRSNARGWEIPSALTGSKIQDILQMSLLGKGLDFQRLSRLIDETTTPQPSSLDISIGIFTGTNGEQLKFPFLLQPDGSMVGQTGLHYDTITAGNGEVLAVETRSGRARAGLVCDGFVQANSVTPYLHDDARLAFMLTNRSENTMIFNGPFAPVQLTRTVYKQFESFDEMRVKLEANGVDVTNERFEDVSRLRVYSTRLAPEMAYYEKTKDPIDIVAGEHKQLLRHASIDEIIERDPGFCLATTEEKIHTGGCPVYMYPFHIEDARGYQGLNNPDLAAGLFAKIFTSADHLPITGNAGLINPGCDGTVVYELISKGRDLKKYLRTGEPFACVIPIPFFDGHIDKESYSKNHDGQRGICL